MRPTLKAQQSSDLALCPNLTRSRVSQQGHNIQPPRIAPGAKPEPVVQNGVPPNPPIYLPNNILLTRFGMLEQAFMALNQRVIDNSAQLRIMHNMNSNNDFKPPNAKAMTGQTAGLPRAKIKPCRNLGFI